MTRSHAFTLRSVLTRALALGTLALPRLALASEPPPKPRAAASVDTLEGPAEARPAAQVSLPGAGAGDPTPGSSEPAPFVQPTPHDGRGTLVAGGLTLGASAAALGLGIGLMVANDHADPKLIGLSVIATAGLAGGTGALVLGARQRAKYRTHVDARHQPRRPQGHGLIVGGTAMLVGGAAALTFSCMFVVIESISLEPEPSSPPMAPLILGATSAVSGAVMLGIGADRNTRWRNGERLEVRPSFSAGRSGASLGLRGRF